MLDTSWPMVLVRDALTLRIVLFVTILTLLYVTSADQEENVGTLERNYKTVKARETF